MAVNNKRCRVCQTVNELELFNWHTEIEGSKLLTYAQCYQQVTQLAVEDNQLTLPQIICYHCARKLCEINQFIEKARRADLTFRLQNGNVNSDTCERAGKEFEWVGITVERQAVSPDIFMKTENIEFSDAKHSDDKPHLRTTTLPKNEYKKFNILNNCDSPEAKAIDSTNNESIVRELGTKNSRKQRLFGFRQGKRPKTRCQISAELENAQLEEKEVVCEYCSKTFSAIQLKRHIANTHKPQSLLCHACPRTFRDSHTLRQHALIHQEDRVRNFTCEQCGRKFYTQGAYGNHVKTHDTNRELFQCDQCEKSFFHKGSLKLHQQRHSGQSIECKICQKRYLRSVDLELHLRSHSGYTPYKCSYCEKSFSQIGMLNKHERIHKGLRYKCHICQKEYTHQSTMIQHRKEHTGLPLKCSLCGKGFVKKSKMRNHIGGVHKIKELEEVDKLIVKVKTKKEYRGRILEDY